MGPALLEVARSLSGYELGCLDFDAQDDNGDTLPPLSSSTDGPSVSALRATRARSDGGGNNGDGNENDNDGEGNENGEDRSGLVGTRTWPVLRSRVLRHHAKVVLARENAAKARRRRPSAHDEDDDDGEGTAPPAVETLPRQRQGR